MMLLCQNAMHMAHSLTRNVPPLPLLAEYLEGSLASLAAVCGPLLTHPAFAAHQVAIAANPALQSKLVALAPDAFRVALSRL